MPGVSRRHFFMTAGAGLLARPAQAAPRPNVLLILADDLASWMLGCYGNREIRTPNIDLLARSGTRFQNSFVCTPICSASRATLFTGRVPRQHGIHDFLTDKPAERPPQGQAAPPPSFAKEMMISDILAAEGYDCGYVGKWHMGNDEQPGHGFRHSYTLSAGPRTNRDPVMSRNGQRVQEQGYLAELMTQEACRFIDEQKAGRPFFLTVGYLNPHTPYDGHPQKYYDMYAKTSFDTVGWQPAAPHALREKDMLQDIVGNIRKCAASVTALDDQIPVLLDRLQQRGMRDNTLVIFTSDNGYLLGRHGLWSKGHASDPINMYEEVMQVPMIWHWRGRTPVEAVRPELVSFYDFLPSLCEAVGVTPPGDRNLCGNSYFPLAAGRALPRGRSWPGTVFGHFRNTEMARDNRFKLVLRNDGTGPNELYNLRTDPGEARNEFDNAAYITVKDRLQGELEAWRRKCV